MFDSFYGRLNEIVIAKLNLGEKIEDTKVVKTWMRSRFKSLLVLFKLMSSACLLTSLANRLLSKL